jgi:hypothetical protein
MMPCEEDLVLEKFRNDELEPVGSDLMLVEAAGRQVRSGSADRTLANKLRGVFPFSVELSAIKP